MATPDMAAQVPRIPKLKYRNHLPADQPPLPSPAVPTANRSSNFTIPEPPCSPTTSSRIEPDHTSSDSRSTTSSFSPPPSLASSNGSATRDPKPSKKKTNGVFGFLTLKEPSQSAFEQFAESQRKQAASKGALSIPAGMQGISPQKLPNNVPRVNSKWDGIPETLKTSKSSSSSSKRDSTSSHSSRQAPSYNPSLETSISSTGSDSSRGPAVSAKNTRRLEKSSNHNGNHRNHTAFPRDSNSDSLRRKDSGRSNSSPPDSPSSLPEMTYFFPDNPNMTGALPDSYSEQPRSPSPLPPDNEQDAFPLPNTDIDDSKSLSELSTHSIYTKADTIFKRLKGNSGFLAGEAQEVGLGQESPDLVPETHDFLFEVQPLPMEPRTILVHPTQTSFSENISPVPSPTATNFSRPRPRPPPKVPFHKSVQPPSLPTLYEASIASRDDASIASTDTAASTDTITDLPVMTKTKETDETSITRSSSSRERLGLGGRIRKNDVLPWESLSPPDKPKKGRLTLFSKSST